MTTSTILSDNGATSGTSGLKTSGGNDGTLILQTTTSGGTATTALTIDTSQNTTLAGNATAKSFIPNNSTVPTDGLYLPAASTVALSTGTTERMRIDSSGRLLFNTTSSASNIYFNDSNITPPVQIVTNTTSAYSGLSIINYSGSAYGGTLNLGCSQSDTKGTNTLTTNTGPVGNINFMGNDGTNFRTCAVIRASIDATSGSGDMPGRLVFLTTADGATDATERARITSGGNLLLAKTSTDTLIVGCAIKGNGEGNFTTSEDTQTVISTSTRTGTAGTGVCLYLDSQLTSGTGGSVMAFYNRNASAYRMFMRPNGNIENTNGSYGTIASERRFKQDIVDVGSQWDDIKNIRLRKFRLKKDVEQFGDDAQVQLGVIIDELEQVCPGLVTESVECVKQRVPLLDEEGNQVLDENGQPQTEEKMVEVDTIKGWKSSVLHLKAVKALQEAMTRIETLEAQNAAFEARLAALESK